MPTQASQLHPGLNSVTFASQGHTIAGNLYLPTSFVADGRYPTVLFSGPFNQVKEQTGAVYAKKLSALGYAVLVFDHLGYGDSEGVIRNNENSFIKIESIRDAISDLGTLPFVDRERLFGLGVCASGGYMALVATTDKRLKAIATVSGMMGNKASYFETMDRQTVTALIAMQNAGRQKFYETGEVDYVDALNMAAGKDSDDAAMREGYDFYMTERAGAVTYPNYSHLSPSFMLEAPMLADAMNYAPYIYTPFMGIVGSKATTAPLTKAFVEQASEPKELVEVEGASHVDLYDRDEHVSVAVTAMTRFFTEHGTEQSVAAE